LKLARGGGVHKMDFGLLQSQLSHLTQQRDGYRVALAEQANFLASLHTTYRHDGRLAARIEAHLTAIRAALTPAQEAQT
jgi:hypothetical protein